MTRSLINFSRLRRIPRRLWALVHLEIVDVVYVLDIADYREGPGPKPGTHVRPLGPEDRAALARAFGDAKASELTARLSTCFATVAFKGDEVVGYSWMTTGPRRGEGEAPFLYDVTPRGGWAYLFDTYVDPKARGLGLATVLKRGLIAEARRRGARRCLATHERSNLAVIHVSEKLGFRLQGLMTFRRILGLTRKDLSGLPEGVRP